MKRQTPDPKDRTGLKHELRTLVSQLVGYSDILLESRGIEPGIRRDLIKIEESSRTLQKLMEDFFIELPSRGNNDVYPLLHDLRTPVNHIIGYTQIILEDLTEKSPEDKIIPDLNTIEETVKRWLVLVERYTSAPASSAVYSETNPEEIDRSEMSPDSAEWMISGLGSGQLSFAQAGHILVVDDDPQNREILGRRLRNQGHLVDSVASGEAALKWMASFTPDLVLLDMLMPGITGRDVLIEMKKTKALANVPVIVVSALDDQSEIARCIGLGAEDYLSTPFNPAVLKARISTCLEKRLLREGEIDHLARLEEEKQKSERLLLNILPEAVANRLKAGEKSIADFFPEVTVIFADLVDFTEMVSRSKPESVLRILNLVFSRLDLLTQKHGLEKIKTIGDAYMAASGLPTAREDHAEAMARFAIDLFAEVSEIQKELDSELTLRVGIDSGPVIAGIIGRNKFTYDLWGDTVNIASRMESTGIPGKIQVSENTWKILKDKFTFAERGEIEIKGKGMMKSWILES